MQYASTAAGTLAGLGLFRGPALAAPVRANTVEEIYFQINWQPSWTNEAAALCQQFTDENFNAQNKGVRAIPYQWGNASGSLASVLAGAKTAPVVVSSCCGDFPIALPMLTRLDPWLSQDNIPRSTWSQGQLLTYQEPDGLYGVPAYTAAQPLIYNQTLFDDLGLSYPDPDWDYIEAEKVWRSIAGKGTNGVEWRYATTIEMQPGYFDSYPFQFHGWGQAEGQFDPTHTKALFNTEKAIASGQWWYQLVWDKVFINRFNGFGVGLDGGGGMAKGYVGMFQEAGSMLYEAATEDNGVKWDVVPWPYWPSGQRATNVQVDYYGINKYYKNQDLAWELFKFVAASEPVNRFLISTTLSFPNLMSMWDVWQDIIQSAAPATRGKQLQWWADAATKGYGYGQQFWKYEEGQEEGVASTILTKVWNQQMDVTEGFNQVAAQTDALQQDAPAMIAAQSWTQTQDQALEKTLFPNPVPGQGA